MESTKSKLAHVVLPCSDIDESIDFYSTELEFRLESIFPADNPRVAALSGYGMRIRLECSKRDNWTERIRLRIPERRSSDLVSPDGVRVEFFDPDRALKIPAPKQVALVSKFKKTADWIKGRAGMRYRDLLPERLGGFMIASHIHISDPGPVADYVHFHDIGFQLIFCINGSAKLVYEDQGEPFLFEAGDCVLQPPGIRHRVLESSGGFDVVEVSSPAEHETHVEHELKLPNDGINHKRLFGGQQFVRSRASEAAWHAKKDGQFEIRDLGIAKASGSIVDGNVTRNAGGADASIEIQAAHMLFAFVIAGKCSLRYSGKEKALKKGDCFVFPRGTEFVLAEVTDDCQLLEVLINKDLACR